MVQPSLHGLPSELINNIYDMVRPQATTLFIVSTPPTLAIVEKQSKPPGRAELDCASKTALAFTQVCQRMRAETTFRIDNIILAGFDLFLPTGSTIPSADPWLHLLQRIPRSLISKTAVVVVRGSWDPLAMPRWNHELGKSARMVGLPTTQLIAAVTSHPLLLQVQVRTHKWGSELKNHLRFEGKQPHSTVLCKKGSHLSGDDCGIITYRMRFAGVDEANKEAIRQMEAQKARIEEHTQQHKCCPIRVESKSMIAGLEKSVDVAQEVIQKVIGRQLRTRGGR